MRWVREHHGEAGVTRVLAAMPDARANAVRAAVNAMLWVPFDAFVSLGETIDRTFGVGDLALCRVLGRYSAKVNLPTVYRIFYKFGSVGYILSKAAALWSAHYDSGSLHVSEVAGGFTIRVERFATPHKVHCMSVLGWMEETVEMTGAKLLGAQETHCRLSGDDACEFQVTYT
jgi:predicted hydrocarbon binding protein